MNLMRINGTIYNPSAYAMITFKNNLLIFYNLEMTLETAEPGPEALAAWEWLQKACIWKMEPVTS